MPSPLGFQRDYNNYNRHAITSMSARSHWMTRIPIMALARGSSMPTFPYPRRTSTRSTRRFLMIWRSCVMHMRKISSSCSPQRIARASYFRPNPAWNGPRRPYRPRSFPDTNCWRRKTVGWRYLEDSPKPPPKRVTLHLSCDKPCSTCGFRLPRGEGSQDILSAILDRPELGLPCSRVRPANWLIVLVR